MLMQPNQVITPGQQPQPQQPVNVPVAAPEAPAQAPNQAQQEDDYSLSWTASEFIAHSKSSGWYGLLVGATVVISAIVFLLTKDKITTAMVLIVGVLFGVMAARKPRELAYTITEDGVSVGNKFYAFGNFKSFSIIQEEGIESIWFMPLQRFMPGLTIYFEPSKVDEIADVLADFLPYEPRKIDPLDKLMHKIRF